MLRALFGQYDIDGVIHLAAESHVDRSIRDPFTFARTNVLGTLSLLEAAREYWDGKWGGQIVLPHLHRRGVRGAGADTSRGRCCGRGERRRALRRGVLHRRDEVRAAQPLLGLESLVRHFVRAYHDTYGMPTLVTNSLEQLRAYQFPEKLIPLFINNIRHRKPLPVYGRGENVRELAGMSKTMASGPSDVMLPIGVRSPIRITSGASTNGRTST